MARSVEETLRRELDVLVPRDDGNVGASWANVLRRAGVTHAPPEPRRRAGTRRFALVAVAVVAVTVVPGLALSSDLRGLVGLSDPRPEPVFAQATLLIQVPADKGEVARLYEAPASLGGTCEFVDRVRPGAPIATSTYDGHRSCQVGPQAQPSPRAMPIRWGLTQQPRTKNNARGWRAPVLDGWVHPDLNAERVLLMWRGGSRELPFANDHFLYVSTTLYAPPVKNLPYEIAALNAAGAEVARVRIFKTAFVRP